MAIALIPSHSIKTLLRSPVRTFLTFVLLGLVTFAFFSQTVEYAVTAREFNNAARQYVGVGTVEVEPPKETYPGFPIPKNQNGSGVDLNGVNTWELIEPYNGTYHPITQEQIDTVSGLPYITLTDTRYMTAGISDEYYRLDDGGSFYRFSSRCLVEGTLEEFYREGRFELVIVLSDCRVLAGSPPWVVDNGLMKIRAIEEPPTPDEVGGASNGPVRMSSVRTPRTIRYNSEYLNDNMTLGGRCVFTFQYDLLGREGEYFLGDHLAEPWCDAILPLDGEPDNYLELDKFAPLRELIEITNADIHTFDMVYTDDMGAIMRFALGKMATVDGRLLTPEDSKSNSQVCVVSREFADAYGLAVGDVVTMNLGAKLFEQYKSLGAVAVYPERYEPPVEAANLEIVGIYADTDGATGQAREPNWSYSINTVFVPKSLLLADETQLAAKMLTPAEYSFMVGDVWKIPAFIDRAAPLIESMGLSLIFFDDGWSDIASGFIETRQASIIKIVVFAAAVVVATWFAVYLFIGRKKKEYAIMRALGATRKTAGRALVLPLMVLAAVSIFAGVATARAYTARTVTRSYDLSMLEAPVNASAPVGIVIGCILGQAALLSVISLAMLRKIGGFAPLALLQGSENPVFRRHDNAKTKIRGAKSKAEKCETAKEPGQTNAKEASSINGRDAYAPQLSHAVAIGSCPMSAQRETVGRSRIAQIRFGLRYVFRHMRRAAGKSVLSILLAALLSSAICQISMMMLSYAELFKSTVITANIAGGLKLSELPQFVDSGYISNLYYAQNQTMDITTANSESYFSTLVITNSISRFVAEDADIAYADGYDASVMDKFGDVIIVGRELMETHGIKPGDTVNIFPPGFILGVRISTVNRYRMSHPDDPITDDEILELLGRQILIDVDRAAHRLTVAGVFTTPSGRFDNMSFAPGSNASSDLHGKEAGLDEVELTLMNNYQADEFRDFGEGVVGGSISGGLIFHMDTARLENLSNTIRLLDMIFPIIMVFTLLVGMFLCGLSILQSSKEAALMRSLGATKAKTRSLLSIEQIFLNVAGLIIGACAMFIYKGAQLAAVSQWLYIFAALYFIAILISSIVCSTIATLKNPLGLLQAD